MGGGLGEFSKFMQPLNYVSGLHNCLKFSQPSLFLGEAMETWKRGSVAQIVNDFLCLVKYDDCLLITFWFVLFS